MSALVTTYGVGELGAIAGVAGAYAERVPVVCIVGAPPLQALEEHALLHHTLADGNFGNMLACHREFTVAQTRIVPADACSEIDRVLRSCWIEKRPVYLQLPSDVAALTIEVPDEPLDLAHLFDRRCAHTHDDASLPDQLRPTQWGNPEKVGTTSQGGDERSAKWRSAAACALPA